MMNTTINITFQKYPAYKDSGVEWLGEIPKHWETSRLRNVFTFNKGLTITKENLQDKGVFCVNYGEIHSKFGFEVNPEIHALKCVSEEFLLTDSNSVLKRGDFIFADTSEDIEGSGNFSFLNSDLQTFAGYHTIIARLKIPVDQRFTAYVVTSQSFRNQIRRRVKGVKVFSITQSILKTIVFWFPPLPEQTAIAAFLDDKTAKIECAIAQKEKMIALLKERKQIIIQNAVTKGLNPNAKMKYSGVEWIGEIPEGWGVKVLRFIGSTQNGISAGAEYFGEGFPFVSYGDVYKNIELPMNVSGLARATDNDRENYSVREGDVFFTRTSETIEEIGFSSTCLNTIENATFAGFLIRFRPIPKVLDPPFSKYYFSSKLHRAFFVKEMNLVIRASLSQELLKKLPVLLPPLDEQRLIAAHIETQSAKIDKAIKLQEQQIEKLKELKSTLIDGAVTGKIKVI